MKRITILVLVLVFLIMNPPKSFAEGWEWVTSNDECSLFIDPYTVSSFYNKFSNETFIDCYAKFELNEEDEDGVKSCIQRTKFRLKTNTTNINDVKYFTSSSTRYDAVGRVISSYTYPYEQWSNLIPYSFVEALFFAAWKYR